MIELATSTARVPTSLLEVKGGFVWWYLDIVDDVGNKFVAIWSFGLPFLPGVARSIRQGEEKPAEQLPSLNLCFYEDGKCKAYMLKQFEPAECSWDGQGTVQLGDCIFRMHNDGSRVRVTADLDLQTTGAGRVRGTFEASGNAVKLPSTNQLPSAHQWSPLSVGADAKVTLTMDGVPFTVQGNGYHDRNWSNIGFEALGIRRWWWARIPHADHTRIRYWLENVDGSQQLLSLTVDQEGQAKLDEEASVVLKGRRLGWFGLSMPAQLQWSDGAVTKTQAPFDDGPFYLRFAVEEEGRVGVGEWVAPRRMDPIGLRRLVDMAVDRGDQSSFWLGLFNGPLEHRFRRFFRRAYGSGLRLQ